MIPAPRIKTTSHSNLLDKVQDFANLIKPRMPRHPLRRFPHGVWQATSLENALSAKVPAESPDVTLARRSLPNIALPLWAKCNLASGMRRGNNFQLILMRRLGRLFTLSPLKIAIY